MCRYNRYILNKKEGKEIRHKYKSVTVVSPVTGYFERTKYDDKLATTIANLVKIRWITRYPCPIEIKYCQG